MRPENIIYLLMAKLRLANGSRRLDSSVGGRATTVPFRCKENTYLCRSMWSAIVKEVVALGLYLSGRSIPHKASRLL